MLSSRRERTNYNCIMEIMNIAVCEGLREIFKQEWDKHYGISKGLWDDTVLTGNELYNMEKTRPAARPYWNVFKAGERSEWDCSALADAILYSNALRMHLAPHIFNKVDELRDLRNKLIHSFGSQHEMSEVAFDNAYKKVENCFNILLLSMVNVRKIRNSWKGNRVTCLWEMRFTRYICFTVFLVGLLCGLLYISPIQHKFLFKVLPRKPVHFVANRSPTVKALLKELRNLSIKNNRALTYLYISGNRGSGKSQLARLVGEQYATTTSHGWFGSTTFVMTLSGRSLGHILNSYIDFAHRLKCNESAISSILVSDATRTAMKVESLQAEIVKALKSINNDYNWLLIVDNVLKVNKLSSFLPQLEDEDWRGGQVLITTQDMSSVPPNSSLAVHVSISEGMDPAESCEFLTDMSGLVENRDLVGKVAKELDYQPLALASAASYVKQRWTGKESAQFTWEDYFKIFNEERHNLAASEINDTNSLTMYTAVRLAVRLAGESDPVLKHAFTFLSFVSHEPLPLHLVENYILHVDQNGNNANIRLRIRECFLVLPSDDTRVLSISLHPVVHDVIKLYIPHDVEDRKSPTPGIVLQMLIQPKIQILEKVLIPHLRFFYIRTENLPREMLIPNSRDLKEEMYKRLLYLATVLEEKYDESFLSKYCRGLGFQMFFMID